MVEHDTIKLLQECDAGVNMGVASIDQVSDFVHNATLKKVLTDYKSEHVKLKHEIETILDRYQDEGKEPSPMAKGMSWISTNVKLALNESDKTISDLMTDGSNMGVKSLNRYLNQYEAADEESKSIAKRLIDLEEHFAVDIRRYL